MANLMAAGCGTISGVLLTRGLGPAGRGELTAVVPIAVLLSSVSLLGLVDYVIWFTARNRSFPGWSTIRKSQLIGLLLAVVTFCMVLTATIIRHPSTLWLAIIAVLSLPAMQTALIKQGYLLGVARYKQLFVVRVLPQLIVLFAALVFHYLSYFNVLLVGTVQLAATAGVCLLFRTGGKSNSEQEERDSQLVFKVSLPAWTAGLPALALQRLDLLLVTILIPSTAQIGFYSAAITLSALPQMVAQSIGMTIRASAVTAESKRRLLGFGADASIFCGFTMALMLAAPYIIPLLLGENFRPAVTPSVLLLCAAIPLGLSTLLAEEMIGFNKFRYVGRAWAIGAVLTATLVASLIPILGIMGAALGCLTGYSITFIAMLLFRSKLL
ncbi:MATE family efflux transporter [Mycolicibacterium monacense]|nr:polysaccharide biosynthesis C-terminal domain-containing protein [Mycolicibacterium monacense]QHP84779.1 hypothetical protein EWR22_05060 [Mycolicibacterium monacense DSM 44395]